MSRVEVVGFYNSYKDSIPPVQENYTFSVIEVPFISGESSESRVYTFLDSLRNQVVGGGASFDSLAIIYSQDFGSSSSGGNLGFTSRGTLVQIYEEAAYALEPGELSFPVRSKFGYHLIRLVDKRGEKISSQHILINVSFSDEDKEASLDEALFIYQQAKNDPFVFDSISVEYDNNYDNFSGVYSSLGPNEIPYMVLNSLNNLTSYKLSQPVQTEDGYALVYLYNHSVSYVPNLDNSWNLIYQYAKQEKQNRLFQDFVTEIKDITFIKIFY